MFWKKKKQEASQDSSIILGMIMLQEENSFDLDAFATDYHHNYGTTLKDLQGDSGSAAFDLEGEIVAIGHMPVPIPAGDLESTAAYAYN